MNRFLNYWKNGWQDFARSFFTLKFFIVSLLVVPTSTSFGLLMGEPFPLAVLIAVMVVIIMQLFNLSGNLQLMYEFARSFKKKQEN